MSSSAAAEALPPDDRLTRESAELDPAEQAKPKPVVAEGTPQAGGFALRGVGFRGSGAWTRAAAEDFGRWSGGGDLYERGLGVLRLDFWSGRYFDELWIGYGEEGLRYQVAGQLGFGVIGLLDDSQGFVMRFAMRGHVRREGGVYSSELRVPGGEAGYFWSQGNRQVEILGHVGATLTGRFNVEGQRRDLRGTSYGSSLSLAWARLRLDADLSQVAAGSDAGAILHARAHFCRVSEDRAGGWTREKGDARRRPTPAGWAVCADFRALRGSTEPLELLESQQLVLGLSVVIGQLAHL